VAHCGMVIIITIIITQRHITDMAVRSFWLGKVGTQKNVDVSV